VFLNHSEGSNPAESDSRGREIRREHKQFTDEQIVALLKQAEAGVPMAELIRRVGISEQTF
jgi:hypothetical protein